jgi:serine/threonine-protein kinase
VSRSRIPGDDTTDVAVASDDSDATVDLHGGSADTRVEAPAPADDELPTTAHRPTPGRTDDPAATTVDSAASALHQIEILRSRMLGKIGSSLSLVVALLVPLLGGDRLGQAFIYTGCALIFVTNVWLVRIASAPDRYRWWKIAVIWYGASIGIGLGVVYFGVASPGSLVCGLGIFFVALGNSRALALGVYLSIASIIGVVSGLITAGVIDDPGLITADQLPLLHQLVMIGLVQILLFSVYLIGTFSARAMAATMGELETAMREIAQREAQLDEARLDLREALRVEGAGPWSGQQVGGWTIGRLVGRGAMGEIYEATRPDVHKPAAIKLLTPAGAANPHLLARFRREVEAASRLVADTVVEVLAISGPSEPFPFLVMELLDGEDLAAVLRERSLSRPEVHEMVAAVSRGLVAAARAGIVHRDIKPHNLFRVSRGPSRWKILDFGVSKLAESSGTLTAGHVVGTPAYMAPEQAQAVDVDHRADTYALAAIAYRCLTGRQPFRGREPAAVLYNVVYKMPLRPTAVATLPRDIDLVLALGMAKDPDQRIGDADAFAAALAAALAERLDPDLRRRGRELLAATPWREP